jgi:uncharacterized protein YjdB
MKKVFVILSFVIVIAKSGFAQLATYVGTGGLSTTVVGVPNETVSSLMDVGFGSNTPCGSGGLSGITVNTIWSAYSISGPHVFIKITPNAGYQLNVTGIDAGLRRSPTGPSCARFAYSLDNGVTWVDDAACHPPINSGCGTTSVSTWSGGALPTGITSVTNGIIVAIFPYLSSNSSGTFQVNTVNVYGNVCSPPLPITGPSAVCSGNSISLSDGSSGGSWSSGATSVAVIDPITGFLTGRSAGTAIITYSTSGCITTQTVTVNQSPLPIFGADSVCVNGTTGLSDIISGGTWSSSNTSVATIGTSGVVTGIYPGISVIIYTTAIGGCTITMPLKVKGISGPTSVCTGSTVTLLSPGGSGVWASSNTASATIDVAGTVTGVSIGTSIISFSSLQCPEQIVMKVNPIAPVIGADSICVAGAAYFTDIVGVGSWSSSNSAVASVSAGPGLVTGIAPGTAVISFATPAGCIAKDTITVIGLPPAITGKTQVCVGSTTVLNNSLAGGVWSSNDPDIATVNPVGVVTGVSPDTTFIVYTIRPACSAKAAIRVNPLPLPIAGRDTLCPGVIDTFIDASSGGAWSTSTPVQDTIVDSTGILTSRLSGTAAINYTLPTGCLVSKAINIYPVPMPLLTYDKFDNTLYSDTGYSGYQWYDSVNAGPIPHATSPSLAGIYNEWFYVVVTDTNGCKSPSAKFHFNNAITGVKNLNGNGISIFPNPATGMLYIESPVTVRAMITGVDGKVEINQANAKILDLSRLASGIYIISLYDEDGGLLTIQKIVKE